MSFATRQVACLSNVWWGAQPNGATSGKCISRQMCFVLGNNWPRGLRLGGTPPPNPHGWGTCVCCPTSSMRCRTPRRGCGRGGKAVLRNNRLKTGKLRLAGKKSDRELDRAPKNRDCKICWVGYFGSFFELTKLKNTSPSKGGTGNKLVSRGKGVQAGLNSKVGGSTLPQEVGVGGGSDPPHQQCIFQKKYLLRRRHGKIFLT